MDESDSSPDKPVDATVLASDLPSSDYMGTDFKEVLVINVTINASVFCDGLPVRVSYILSGSGKFDNANVFTAQLSNSSGSFSSPVIIGSVQSKQSGVINAIIPYGTPIGSLYRIRVVSSSPVITSNTNGTNITINNTPASPTYVSAQPSSTCMGASSSLIATSAGNSIRWYTSPTGGSLLGTSASGANFSVTPLSTTTYYAESISPAGCISPLRTSVTVTVKSIPAITSTSPGSICGTGSVILNAASSSGIINWYSEATTGVLLGTGINFTTPVIARTTTFYVDATENGCVSPARTPVIATVYSLPEAPRAGTITQPTCTVSTGSIVLTGLPPIGTWILTGTPGGTVKTGTGTSTTITGLEAGAYTFTVTNTLGCVSPVSANIVINAAPGYPSAPIPGSITQPNCTVSTGSVVLNGLPAPGTWTLTRTPGGTTTMGTGTSTTITGLSAGTYTFTVANASGCISITSAIVTINVQPVIPTANAGAGGNECDLNFKFSAIPSIGTGLWSQTSGTGSSTFTPNANTPDATVTVSAYGKYTYTWTEAYTACSKTSMVNVNFYQPPVADAGPDQVIVYSFEATLDAASLGFGQTGEWTIISGTGEIENKNDNTTQVSQLSPDKNSFIWTLNDRICPSSSDTVNIFIRDRIIPTLITPNKDGRNDCFVIRGIESFGKTELVVFNRWGVRVYENDNYDNKWEGVDHNVQPLPDGTYFYVLKPEKSVPVSGYIVILR